MPRVTELERFPEGKGAQAMLRPSRREEVWNLTYCESPGLEQAPDTKHNFQREVFPPFVLSWSYEERAIG
jgi:hypothetical protein